MLLKPRIQSRLLTVLLMASGAALGQTAENTDAAEVLRDVFNNGRRTPVPVLLLGTFHFKDAGLDEYKPQHDIDVFAPERQRELDDLADRLARFRPTKIAVERMPEAQEELDSRYQAYLDGEWELEANEIYQVGFRLAKKLGLPGVRAVDAHGRFLEPRVDPEAYAKEHQLTDMLRNRYSMSFFRLGQIKDQRKTEHSLRDHLLFMNDPTMLRASHGLYLQRSISLGMDDEFPVADGFISQWYNRNLRIFANLHRISDGESDRILVIFGAGHMPLLRQFVESAAEFELVEVSEVL